MNAPPVFCLSFKGVVHQPGEGEVDIDKIEDEEKTEDQNRKGRALGLPEIDPDALPSSLANKYWNLCCTNLVGYLLKPFVVIRNCSVLRMFKVYLFFCKVVYRCILRVAVAKRMKKMQEIHQKFTDATATLSDIQKRCFGPTS